MKDLYNEDEDCDVCKNGGFPCTCTTEHLEKRKTHEYLEDVKWDRELEAKIERDCRENFMSNVGGSAVKFEPNISIEMKELKEGEGLPEGQIMIIAGVTGVKK